MGNIADKELWREEGKMVMKNKAPGNEENPGSIGEIADYLAKLLI